MGYSSIEILLRTKKTIFTIEELAFLWRINNPNTLKSKVYFLVKNKKLIPLHKGIYTFTEDYDKFELAGKLKSPSYVSLETVLYKEGVIFQYSTDITSISNVTKTIKCDRINYIYHKLKDEILFNRKGLEILDNYFMASLERAFLDMIYLNKSYYVDNLRPINWEKCFSLVEIYKNKTLRKRLREYQKDYVEQSQA